MKKLLLTLTILFVVFFVKAQEIPNREGNIVPIYDEIGLLNSTQKLKLTKKISSIEDSNAIQIQIIIIDSLKEFSVEQYVKYWSEKWEINNGILFFDELPHFSKDIIEALREPLEDHSILVSRVNTKIKYDTKFLFISAMNPCPCGNLLSKTKECRCNELEINRYKNRLSDPFLDRIDLMVTMGEVFIDDKPDIDSTMMHRLVLKTFLAQKRRGQKELNGKLSEEDIQKYCPLDSESQNILDRAILQFSLSFRAINKVLKVARTIADIEESLNIQKSHILEALSYRRR